jgi:hypothetical protein
MEYEMKSFYDILPNLIDRYPTIVSKETIEKLVLADKNALSFETASACIGSLDVFKERLETLSKEEQTPIDKDSSGDYSTKKEKDFVLEDSIRHNFANVKFQSLVDYAKKEDTFLYTEFVDIDAARNRIASEIVSKYENEFNSFLVALKAAEGVEKSVIDSLLQTKIHVGELN